MKRLEPLNGTDGNSIPETKALTHYTKLLHVHYTKLVIGQSLVVMIPFSFFTSSGKASSVIEVTHAYGGGTLVPAAAEHIVRVMQESIHTRGVNSLKYVVKTNTTRFTACGWTTPHTKFEAASWRRDRLPNSAC